MLCPGVRLCDCCVGGWERWFGEWIMMRKGALVRCDDFEACLLPAGAVSGRAPPDPARKRSSSGRPDLEQLGFMREGWAVWDSGRIVVLTTNAQQLERNSMAVNLATTSMNTTTAKRSMNTTSKRTTEMMKVRQKGKTGLRTVLKKWKEMMKMPKKGSPTQDDVQRPKTSPATTPVPAESSVSLSTVRTSSMPPSRQNPSGNAQNPSQSSATRPLASRRNTVPADYFPKPASAPVGIPMNTITTTISAAQPRDTSRRRSRLLIMKRSSTQPSLDRPPAFAPTSYTPFSHPSAPNPASHTDRRATFQFATAAEVAARIDEERLRSAVDIRLKEKPQDWREGEKTEDEIQKPIEAEMLPGGGTEVREETTR